MKLLMLTFANNKNILLDNLIFSFKKYNYEYKVIGYGVKWVNFMTKINACYDYLINLDGYDIICIVDSYDVLACDYSDILVSKFLDYKKRIVVGAENACGGNCVPLDNYYKNKNKKGRYTYVNGGFYMGYKNDIIHMLKYILNLNISDDQIGLGKYINKYPRNIAVDENGLLVSNINIYGSYFDTYWVNNKVKNIKTREYPCLIHTPSIQYDLHSRMDYFGDKILGKKYTKYSFNKKITRFYNKYTNKIYYFLFFLFVIFVLFILCFRIF